MTKYEASTIEAVYGWKAAGSGMSSDREFIKTTEGRPPNPIVEWLVLSPWPVQVLVGVVGLALVVLALRRLRAGLSTASEPARRASTTEVR